MRGKPWTDADDHALVRMFEAGVTYDAIAKTLGRSTAAVGARLNGKGLLRRPQRGGPATLDPSDRYRRPPMGSLHRDIPEAVQVRIVRTAETAGTTIAGAIGRLLG